MMPVALIACGAGKLPYKAAAWEFYNGSLAVAARRDVEAREMPYWFISALHMLVPRHRRLQPYNLRLQSFTEHERLRWGSQVVQQLGLLMRLDGRMVEIHAGSVYQAALQEALTREGAEVVLLPPGHLQVGERLAWYAARAQQRDRAPDLAVEPWTLLDLESWQPGRELAADMGDDPPTYWPGRVEPTAIANVTWNLERLRHVATVDEQLTDAQLDEDGLRVPVIPSSRLVVHRWAWRRLLHGGARQGEQLSLPFAMTRLAQQLAGTSGALEELMRAAEEILPTLRPATLLLGRRDRMVVKASSTDPMLNITGQVTELIVPGCGRVWVRENIGDRGRASAGERWGWHQGHTSRSREIHELAAPEWAWPFVATSVRGIDHHHRRVVRHDEWTLPKVRVRADMSAWRA